MNMEKCSNVLGVNIFLDMLQMDENKLEELLTLSRDNNKMLKDIWTVLNNPNNDVSKESKLLLFLEKIEHSKGMTNFLSKLYTPRTKPLSLIPFIEIYT